MRPTFSIILFTVLSGTGYGLWFLIALGTLLLWPEVHPGEAMTLHLRPALLDFGLVTGFILVSMGLLSSLGHLGKPGRAWRAFSQWRSSWLSREGVAAVLTYIPVIGLAWLLIHGSWLEQVSSFVNDAPTDPVRKAPIVDILSIALSVGSLVTVYCTANIYACLKPVRAWNNRFVAAGYLLLALYGGGLAAWALTTLPQAQVNDLRVLLVEVALTGVAAALLKWRYWRFIDRASTLTSADATGLQSIGSVRSFEQPHTEENYLTHEMGFRIARKHSLKLRRIALFAGFLLPASLVLLALLMPSVERWLAWLALALGLFGIFVERWLFFAEARHTVMLYYGARST